MGEKRGKKKYRKVFLGKRDGPAEDGNAQREENLKGALGMEVKGLKLADALE